MIEEKQLLLDEISEKISSSNGFIVTRYEKMTAEHARTLRNAVADFSGEVQVVPKRVFGKALEVNNISSLGFEMKGHIAVVFSQGQISPLAKSVMDFSEKNQGVLECLGGVVDGVTCNQKMMQEIADLPPLEGMRAMFIGALQGPLSHTVGVMRAHLASLLYCMDAKAEQQKD